MQSSSLAAGPSRITRIVVDKLFGDYDYILPNDERDLSHLFILYGSNGSGKTTILNLLFSLLLARGKPGSKTYIAHTPFRKFSVEFDEGTIVSAVRRGKALVGAYDIEIRRPDASPFIFQIAMSEDNPNLVKQDIDELLDEIKKLKLWIYFLPDDRRVSTSAQADIRSALAYGLYFFPGTIARYSVLHKTGARTRGPRF